MRPVEDWADRKYLPGTAVAHLVPFGELGAICGELDVHGGWFGTGCFEEIERAERLPVCDACKEKASPTAQLHNEFTAPSPLYAHQESA